MAVQFPDTLQPIDPVETDINDICRVFDYKYASHLTKVGKNGESPGELSRPRAVAIDENSHHIYVTELITARVSIFSEHGEFLSSFTHILMEQPYGIAIYQNNVYISDMVVHGVFQFKIETDIRLEAALVGKGSGDGKFKYPHQLTVNDNGEVFIADCFNHRIQILEESLHFQRSIKHDSMRYPLDVKLTNNEIFVLTEGSPCVIVFSHTGEKLRSLITRGHGMQVTYPWFFCLDTLNNLIISDNGAKSIKIFSPDATLIQSIEEVTQIPHRLQGIALSKQSKFVLMGNDEHFQLQIYAC